MKKLKWCVWSLFGLFMLVVLMTIYGTLFSARQFIWQLQRMDREEALTWIVNTYYLVALETGVGELAIEQVRTMANDFLDAKITSLTLQERIFLDVSNSKAFDTGGRAVTISCIISLIWLNLWEAKKQKEEQQ